MPDGQSIDFEKYKSLTNGEPAEGEQAMPENQATEVEPELD